MVQQLITEGQMAALRANGQLTAATPGGVDHVPVVKLFTPDANATWLLTELDKDGDTLFGLCDLGHGTPELGYVSLEEIQQLRGRLKLPVERDQYTSFDKKLTEYAAAARAAGRIVV